MKVCSRRGVEIDQMKCSDFWKLQSGVWFWECPEVFNCWWTIWPEGKSSGSQPGRISAMMQHWWMSLMILCALDLHCLVWMSCRHDNDVHSEQSDEKFSAYSFHTIVEILTCLSLLRRCFLYWGGDVCNEKSTRYMLVVTLSTVVSLILRRV